MIFLDGVYVDDASSVKKFRWIKGWKAVVAMAQWA
jgi:hypothetical protein